MISCLTPPLQFSHSNVNLFIAQYTFIGHSQWVTSVVDRVLQQWSALTTQHLESLPSVVFLKYFYSQIFVFLVHSTSSYTFFFLKYETLPVQLRFSFNSQPVLIVALSGGRNTPFNKALSLLYCFCYTFSVGLYQFRLFICQVLFTLLINLTTHTD